MFMPTSYIFLCLPVSSCSSSCLFVLPDIPINRSSLALPHLVIVQHTRDLVLELLGVGEGLVFTDREDAEEPFSGPVVVVANLL